MQRYRFTGLTDEFRLIQTMIDQSKMEPGDAAFVVRNNLERCVEIWEGDTLCGYFVIAKKDGVRSLHGYNLTKGRGRHAFRICLQLLAGEKGNLYSCHKEVNSKVNRLLKLLGFKEVGRINNEIFMEQQAIAVPV